jgi:hypothetical protein
VVETVPPARQNVVVQGPIVAPNRRQLGQSYYYYSSLSLDANVVVQQQQQQQQLVVVVMMMMKPAPAVQASPTMEEKQRMTIQLQSDRME